MPVSASLSRFAFALAAVVALVASGLAADPAGATVRAFHPTRMAVHSVSFKPRGLKPFRVRRAVVRVHKHGHTIKHKVSAERVRHAISEGKEIRVIIPGAGNGAESDGKGSSTGSGSETHPGELLVSVNPPPSAPTSPPATETEAGCSAGAITAALSTSSRTPAACWRPYSSSSPFNTEVAPGAATVSNSQGIVENWFSTWSASEKTSSPRFSATTSESEEDYNHPLYFSNESDPAYTIHCTETWGICPIEGDQVHVPAGAEASSGSDGHLAVIETASGWEYDFWQTGALPAGGGQLDISWGGRTRIDGSGLGSPATAGNFGLAAGIIRPEELAAGQIDHALFMVVKCTNGVSVYPAGPDTGRSCSSIGLSNTDAPAMGQHFVLAMTAAEIEALPDPAWQKTVLKAMAEYGLYVGDTGGGFLKTESGVSFSSLGMSDPWTGLASTVTAAARSAAVSSGLAISPECINFEMSGAVDWRSKLEVVSP